MRRSKNEKIWSGDGIEVDFTLPREERIRSFLDQVGDPYRFRSGDVTVNVRDGGGRPGDEAVAHELASSDNARSAIPPDLLAG